MSKLVKTTTSNSYARQEGELPTSQFTMPTFEGFALRDCSVQMERLTTAEILKWQGGSSGKKRKSRSIDKKMDATPGTSSKALRCDRNYPSTSSSLQPLSPIEPDHSAGKKRKSRSIDKKMDATPGTSSKALRCDRNYPSTTSSLQPLSPLEPDHSAGKKRKSRSIDKKMDATPATSSKALRCDLNYPSTTSSQQPLSPIEPDHSAGKKRKSRSIDKKMDATPGTSSKALQCDLNYPSTSSSLQLLSSLEPDHSAANSESVNPVTSLPSYDLAALHPSHATPNAPPERPLRLSSLPTVDQLRPCPVHSPDPSPTVAQKLDNIEKTVDWFKTHLSGILSQQRKDIYIMKRVCVQKVNQMKGNKKLKLVRKNRCSTQFQVSRMKPLRRTRKRKNEDDICLNRVEENVELNSVETIPNQAQRKENRGFIESDLGLQQAANTHQLDAGTTSHASKSIESQPSSTPKIRVIETYKLLANVETLPNQEQPDPITRFNEEPSPTGASSSKMPAVSAFEDGWFQEVPKNENEPPTPFNGCCHSCYEYRDVLTFNHCKRCWSEINKLKTKFLGDSETPLPQCSHHLNRPMRGCEACILRAFILRFNNRHPGLPFEIPYARVSPSIHVKRQLVPRTESTKTNKPADLVQKASSSKKAAVTAFADGWFQVVSKNENEPSIPFDGCCYSCNEYKSMLQHHCKDCWSKAKCLVAEYLKNPNIPNSRCRHPLKKPMEGCDFCFLRTFISKYNLKIPTAKFKVSHQNVDRSCGNNNPPKTVQNLSVSPLVIGVPQDAGRTNIGATCIPKAGVKQCEPHKLISDFDENLFLKISDETLNPPPPETSNFPKGYFLKTSDDVYELPTVRHGCCISCYEYKKRIYDNCADCYSTAKDLQGRFQKDPNTPLPQCMHTLNNPLKGCKACIIRAFIIHYNKKHPDNPYAIPYKSFDDKIPDDRLQQLQSPPVYSQPEHALNTRAGFSDFSTKSNDEKGIPEYFNDAPGPFPENWFLQTSTDPNIPPTTFRGFCQSCYECKKTRYNATACPTCRASFERLKQNLRKEGFKEPDCGHQLNQPMRHCFGCSVKAYRQRTGINFIDS